MHVIRAAMVAQWWERSPPTSVARIQIPASTTYVGWVCCWFSPLLREDYEDYVKRSFLFIVVIVTSIFLKTTFSQISIHSQLLVKILWRSDKEKTTFKAIEKYRYGSKKLYRNTLTDGVKEDIALIFTHSWYLALYRKCTEMVSPCLSPRPHYPCWPEADGAAYKFPGDVLRATVFETDLEAK